MPNTASETLAGLGTAQTFTANQTFTTSGGTTSLLTGSTTVNLFNAVPTTVNFAGAATTLNIGNASGVNTLLGDTKVNDLYILDFTGGSTYKKALTSNTTTNILNVGEDFTTISLKPSSGNALTWNGTSLTTSGTLTVAVTGVTTFTGGGVTINVNSSLGSGTGSYYQASGSFTSASSTATLSHFLSPGTISLTSTSTATFNDFSSALTISNVASGATVNGYSFDPASVSNTGEVRGAYINLADATNRWSIKSVGTAPSYFGGPVQFPSYTVAGVPSASVAARYIYVSNESGGAVMAFSDGTNWRRVTDRAIIT